MWKGYKQTNKLRYFPIYKIKIFGTQSFNIIQKKYKLNYKQKNRLADVIECIL